MLLGQSAELSWTASAGTSCRADGDWSGSKPSTGSETIAPSATGPASYTLTCSGGGFSDFARTVMLDVTAARLSALQVSVFTAQCAFCHDGSQPPNGALPGSMNLNAGNTFSSTVGVPSQQQGNMHRVAPGDPAASYLMRKVEGAPGISGVRMPLGGPPLDAETIAQIRSWIAAGAPND